MYRLVRFKATNVLGFMSGMGKKTVEIDLESLLDKQIIVICGDNATGKSTFLSLVHPWNTPINGKSRFIAPGKEGTIIREYLGDDGTRIISKCIYKPRPKKEGKDDGHTSSCYLEITKPGCDSVELNPNGNVSSYQSLLYTYLGITKDYLTFASYTTEIAGIVKMTDTERKNSVGTLVPNTKRFEIAYDIVSERYKELRNMIRNISQKIVSLRDEESLSADLKRVSKELQQYTEEREDRIRKLSKMEGRLKELTKGNDVNDMISEYNRMIVNLASYDSEIDRVYNRLMKLYDKLGIEPDREDSINFSGIDRIPSNIMKYEKKLAASESTSLGYETRAEQLRNELHATETDINETESLLYSIQAQNIDELIATRDAYYRQLEELRYTKLQDQFEGMSYDEVVSFSRTVTMIDSMIQALYDEYGDLVSKYFSSTDWNGTRERAAADAERLQATIITATAKKDQIYRQLIEKKQYEKFQTILEQRPKACTIDTCPFIANALKWQNIASEIATLIDDYKQSSIDLQDLTKEQSAVTAELEMHDDAQKLVQYLLTNQSLILKYFKIDSLNTLYRAIANGTWGDILDIMRLKDIASILSEKELYLQIANMEIPAIENAIELAKAHGTNRDYLLHQLERLNSTRKLLKNGLSEMKMHIGISMEQHDRYERQLKLWREVQENVNRYRELITTQLETKAKADQQDASISIIKELIDKCREQEHLIQELDTLIRERVPKREQIKLDLDAVQRLQIEKLEVERDFIVIDVIRSIVAPGKSIRKELINIYMYDICVIANQLLLNTFGGKLYLEQFEITDKMFVIPYVYNGEAGTDISYSSASQQATISSAISLAIISKMISNYGIYTLDECDGPLNTKNKNEFIQILTSQMRYVGITQAFIITQDPERYVPYSPGYVTFPGAELHGKDLDIVEVG